MPPRSLLAQTAPQFSPMDQTTRNTTKSAKQRCHHRLQRGWVTWGASLGRRLSGAPYLTQKASLAPQDPDAFAASID